jgi:phosphate transport system substrate-binding protein
LKETVIARDGIAVIVNKNNPCSNLLLEDVRDIFAGKIRNWNNEELKND